MNIAPPYDIIYGVTWLVILIVVISGLTAYNDWSCK
jgi:hypothetical protein